MMNNTMYNYINNTSYSQCHTHNKQNQNTSYNINPPPLNITSSFSPTLTSPYTTENQNPNNNFNISSYHSFPSPRHCQTPRNNSSHNKIISSLHKQISLLNAENNSYKTENEITTLLYNDLSSFNSYMKTCKETNDKLLNENANLKEALHKKEEIISQFEDVIKESTIKFEELERKTSWKKNKMLSQHIASTDALMNQVDNLKMQINKRDIEIDNLNKNIITLNEERNELLHRINDMNYQNAKANEMINEDVRRLEKENEDLKMEKYTLINECNKIKQYVFTMEETCCVYKQEREKIENEFNKRLNEYVDTISQLRKYLRDKEKENEELKKKLLKDNKSNKC